MRINQTTAFTGTAATAAAFAYASTVAVHAFTMWSSPIVNQPNKRFTRWPSEVLN